MLYRHGYANHTNYFLMIYLIAISVVVISDDTLNRLVVCDRLYCEFTEPRSNFYRLEIAYRIL